METICPRCRQPVTETITIGRSTFCASCLAGVEALIVANVPPVAQAAEEADAPTAPKRRGRLASGDEA